MRYLRQLAVRKERHQLARHMLAKWPAHTGSEEPTPSRRFLVRHRSGVDALRPFLRLDSLELQVEDLLIGHQGGSGYETLRWMRIAEHQLRELQNGRLERTPAIS